jgi:hypothetical protein
MPCMEPYHQMIVPPISVVSYGYTTWAIYAFQQPWKQVA